MATLKPANALLDTHRSLIDTIASKRAARSRSTFPPPSLSSAASPRSRYSEPLDDKAAKKARYTTYVSEEETLRNNLPARYAATGDWGANFIAGATEEDRFVEYPRLHRLLALKKAQVDQHSHPPLLLRLPDSSPLAQVASTLVDQLGTKNRFDSILVTPPPDVDWAALGSLPVRSLAADVSFCFLWCGPENELEEAKACLGRWGFRRAEEVTWLKTNMKSNAGPGTEPPTSSIFLNAKEHLLVGIRGQLRRATDGWFVHTNIDADVIVWEGNRLDPYQRPPEAYSLVENLCMGTRRLDLFGTRPRRGWVTVNFSDLLPHGDDEEGAERTTLEELEKKVSGETLAEAEPEGRWTEFDPDTYEGLTSINGQHVVPVTADIENLRPKSPSNRGRPHSSTFGHSSTTNQASQYNTPHPLPQYPPHQPFVQQRPQQLQNQFGTQGYEVRMPSGVGMGGMAGMNGVVGSAGMFNEMQMGLMGAGGFDPLQNQYLTLQQQQYAFQQQQQLILMQQRQMMGFPPMNGFNGFSG